MCVSCNIYRRHKPGVNSNMGNETGKHYQSRSSPINDPNLNRDYQ